MPLQPEQAAHINVINWFNHEYPDYAQDFHHFANERKCSVIQGRTLKRMGVKKGVLDFYLALPLNGKSGFWIELKIGKNNPTIEQLDFAERKLMRGYLVAFVWGFDEAKDVISFYMNDYLSNNAKNDPIYVYKSGPIC